MIWLTFVETQNLTLEEIAVVFDGREDLQTALTQVARENAESDVDVKQQDHTDKIRTEKHIEDASESI